MPVELPSKFYKPFQLLKIYFLLCILSLENPKGKFETTESSLTARMFGILKLRDETFKLYKSLLETNT